jgi:hypothetical protein
MKKIRRRREGSRSTRRQHTCKLWSSSPPAPRVRGGGGVTFAEEERDARRCVSRPRRAVVWMVTRVDQRGLGWIKFQSRSSQIRFGGRRGSSHPRGLRSPSRGGLGPFHAEPGVAKRNLTTGVFECMSYFLAHPFLA